VVFSGQNDIAIDSIILLKFTRYFAANSAEHYHNQKMNRILEVYLHVACLPNIKCKSLGLIPGTAKTKTKDEQYTN
jgi:hypothetical protein